MNNLELYNHYYNLECMGLAHGGPVSMQEVQAIALSCMVKTLENPATQSINIVEAQELIDALTEQGRESIRTLVELAQKPTTATDSEA